jgi:regulator of RNase E activity RraA
MELKDRILAPEIIEAYKKLDTTEVADAINRFGYNTGMFGLNTIVPGTRICGQAFTCLFGVCQGGFEGKMDYLDEVPAGNVIVLDNNGRMDYSCWGDLMSRVALRNGVEGTICDGIIRDVPDIREMKYPIFAKATHMWTGKMHTYLEAAQVPVRICGVVVNPGDLIIGDDTGVLSVPFEVAEKVLAAAQEIHEREKVIMKFIEQGMRLDKAREETGYYFLQEAKKAQK